MKKQKNVGFLNTNNSFDVANLNITVEHKDTGITLMDIIGAYKEKFAKQDAIINSKFTEKIVVNKTNAREKYDTNKMIKSLTTIGIPIDVIYSIAQSTIDKITQKISQDDLKELSTKDIRKMVSLEIQNYPSDNYSLREIDEWSEKYVRRYGHNSRIVEIYKSDECFPVSYDFIINSLIPDIIREISPGWNISSHMTKNQINDLANEILDFINNCALYKIKYELLRDMIIEISLQPPHPWLVNDGTKQEIITYDKEQLEHNIEKLNKAITNMPSNIPQSVIIEVLHHGSSMMLARYNHFLGIKDSSAFYMFKRIINNLNQESYYDLVLDDCMLGNVLEDIAYAGEDANKLYKLMDEITELLEHRRITIPLAKKAIEYGNLLLNLTSERTKVDTEKFILSKWNDSSDSDVVAYIKNVLCSIAPCGNTSYKNTKNYFWISYKNTLIESSNKNMVLVYYTKDGIIGNDFIETLLKNKSRIACDKIFLVSENENQVIEAKRDIMKKVDSCIDYYQIFTLYKKNISDLFYSQEKYLFLKTILNKQFEDAINEIL